MSNIGLLGDLTTNPPDNLLDCDEINDKAEVNNGDSLSQATDDSTSSSPIIPALPIKSYANDSAEKDETTRGPHNNTEDDDNAMKLQKKKAPVDIQEPKIRRSSRANKGIAKEIFDPSYIPSPRNKDKSLDTLTKKFHSPSSDCATSPVSPSKSKSRIVIGQSPRRRKHSLSDHDEDEKSATEKKKLADQKKKLKEDKSKGIGKSIEMTEQLKESKKVMSKDDFSDDDDNVPLNQLKEESSSDEDSDDSYNNPNRLWCICRKPHNNRFMISCDQCEDWFHGDCVGITLQRGKKMEENNEEYVCPECVKKQSGRESPFNLNPNPSSHKRKLIDSEQENAKIQQKPHKRSVALDEKLKSSGKTLKGYALLGQIQPASNKSSGGGGQPQKKKIKVFDQAKSKADSKKKNTEGTKTTDNSDKKATSEDKSKSSSARKCIVSSCNNDALPGSVYCSNQCILRHAKESLKAIVKDKDKPELKQKLVKRENKEGSTGSHSQHKVLDLKKRIPVVCKKTNKLLTGSSAPYRRDLEFFFKTHPNYEIYRPHSSKLDKAQTKFSGESKSVDFYKHVENQNRKRDRYGTDPDYAPPVKKLSDGSSLLDKKQRSVTDVSKTSSQSGSSLSKLNQSGVSLLKQAEKLNANANRPGHSTSSLTKTNQSSSNKIHKHRKESIETKKHEAAKVAEKRDSKSKEFKRKHSSDGSQKKHDEKPAKKVERSSSGGSKSESKSSSQTSTTDIRQNIKKSLFDILKHRSESSEDLKMHPDSISKLASKIEESLFKVHADTNTKYKNKYRSITFNLKDTRNHGLWRKVIIGEVTTSELVQMSAEQMASKKLAEWRQNELTQELDIIQKQEKEKANVRPVAKITHKGEIAIQEDLSDLTENFNNRDSSSNPTVAPVRKKRISLSEDNIFDSSSTPASQDTTLQHHEHLFDLNCKICTGKIKEEDLDHQDLSTETSKKVKLSTSIILSSEAQSISNKSSDDSAPKSHIVISEKTKLKKKKSRDVEESNINSHDSSLSPASFLSKLSQEKQKKKKPILPAPPPLSDIPERDAGDSSGDAESKAGKTSDDPAAISKDKNSPTEKPPSEDLPPKPAKTSSSKLIWSGLISMLELSTFKANVYPVNGCCTNLDIDLPVRLMLGGRIHPRVVWDYLNKVSALPTKQLSVVRFHAATDDDRVGYVAMLSYFSSRKRFGVVSNQDRMLVKDMYLIPLLESQPVPEQLISCSSGIESSLPANRPSMLLGIVVRQATKKPTVISSVDPSITSSKSSEEVHEEEEYIPGVTPLLKDRTPSPAPLLADEELGVKTNSKSTSGSSLFERNRNLAPSLRFFMRKQSEEEQSRKELLNDDEQPYSPSEGIDKDKEEGGDYDPEDAIGGDDEEPYDPEKMFQDEEEYDPETAFPPISPKDDDNIPYDPEEDEELLKVASEAKEDEELAEKQAFIAKMKKELMQEKAKLAQVEQSLHESTMAVAEEPPTRVDPRLAKRAALAEEKNHSEVPKPPTVEPSHIPVEKEKVPPPTSPTQSEETIKKVDPLQTILSVLNMTQSKPAIATSVAGALKVFQKPPSPPQLPDSTTKSDAEDSEERKGVDKREGLVAYAASPDSSNGDKDVDKKTHKKRDDRRRRSSSVSSTSSHGSSHRRHRHDYDDKKHRRHRRSRSRSPLRRGRHSPRHHRRHDDDHRKRQRRSWSRDRRR